MKASKEIIAVTGIALIVTVGALAVDNYNKDQDRLRDDRLNSLRQVDGIVNETVTLKSGAVINFGPSPVGGDGERQDAYTVKNGTVITIYKPLVSSKYPNSFAVSIPGKNGELTDKIGWVDAKDDNGQPRSDIVVEPIVGLPLEQPASVSPSGQLIVEGRGLVPSDQVAIAEYHENEE